MVNKHDRSCLLQSPFGECTRSLVFGQTHSLYVYTALLSRSGTLQFSQFPVLHDCLGGQWFHDEESLKKVVTNFFSKKMTQCGMPQALINSRTDIKNAPLCMAAYDEKLDKISCNFQENLKKLKGIYRKWVIITENF